MKKAAVFKRVERFTKAEEKLFRKFVPPPVSKFDWLLAVSMVPHQAFIWKPRTTEIAQVLGISRNKAYALCCEAERLGILTGSQTSADYTEQENRGETKKFSRHSIVWEIWIKRRGKPDLTSGDGPEQLGELSDAIRSKLKRGLAK